MPCTVNAVGIIFYVMYVMFDKIISKYQDIIVYCFDNCLYLFLPFLGIIYFVLAIFCSLVTLFVGLFNDYF